MVETKIQVLCTVSYADVMSISDDFPDCVAAFFSTLGLKDALARILSEEHPEAVKGALISGNTCSCPDICKPIDEKLRRRISQAIKDAEAVGVLNYPAEATVITVSIAIGRTCAGRIFVD